MRTFTVKATAKAKTVRTLENVTLNLDGTSAIALKRLIGQTNNYDFKHAANKPPGALESFPFEPLNDTEANALLQTIFSALCEALEAK
jgi:hypothetical protein